MLPIIIILLVISAAVGFYAYRLLRRAFETFGADTAKKGIKICIIVLSVCIGVICASGMSFAAIVLLHFVIFCLLMQLINFIVKKASGEKYQTCFLWKKIYASCAIPIAVTAIVMIFGYINMHNVIQTNYTIYTDKNIRDEGYRIALISDTHYGVSIGYEELTEICEKISSQNVDIVILCGDIVDDDTTAKGIEEVFYALSAIKSNYGIFYIYGNHDRPYSFIESNYTEEELTGIITKNNIKILRDELYEINDDFIIAGREDISARQRVSIADLLENTDKNSFILTLDHQPRDYTANGNAGTDLVLSGHTHGGQIWPVNVIDGILKINDAVYGHTQIDDDTQAIVTSGIAGWRYPIKTSAPAEYVIIDIKHSA